MTFNHYSTPPHEHVNNIHDDAKARHLSLDPNQRTLYPLPPLSRRSSLLEQVHTLTPSVSRRGSATDPSLHAATIRPLRSPPPSPAHQYASPVVMGQSSLDTWPDRLQPNSGGSSSWRRDSLPPITHLTGETHAYPPSAVLPLQSRHLLDDTTVRRHSIASITNDAYGSDDASQTPRNLPRRASNQGPYSRSPELRVSHKLAERKRRKEMKDLFDDLRVVLPFDQGVKTSKWEILSKAVDYISHLQGREEQFAREKEQLLKDLANLRAGK